MNVFIFICLGIFITSLFWWPKAPVPFEVPKVIFFQWFVRVLALVFAATFFLKKKFWRFNLKLLVPILVFVVWATITSIVGKDVPKSFVGNYFRQDGLITFYELIGFSLFVSYFWKEKFKKIISLTFFYSSLLLSFLALVEILRHKFGLGNAATFGNPVFLAGYLSVSFPFGLYLLKSAKQKWYLAGLTINALTVVLISAVSSTLTLIVFAIFWIIFFQRKIIKFILATLLIGVFILLLFFWSRNYYLENSKILIAEGRERIVQNVLRGVAKSPILGYGWANVDYAFDAGEWPIKFNDDVYVDKAHSGLLEILTTTGVPGFFIYLYFLYVFLKQLLIKYKKSKDRLWNFILFSTALLYLFHSQTNVISITEEIIFWFVVGITLSVFEENRAQPVSPGRRLKPKP